MHQRSPRRRTTGRRTRSLAGAAALATVLAATPTLLQAPASAAPSAQSKPAAQGKPTAGAPLVIGHRGASGYRPEHTLAAYSLAIDLGADFIEPDLVSTKDGVLVARHENEISETTDVAARPEFADRRTTKTVDGTGFTGWFTEDFTLAELKTLRAKERIPAIRQENTLYNGRYEVPTFQEIVDLAKAATKRTKRTIGIYPETKHPTYFDSIGLSLEEPLVAVLERNGYKSAKDPVFVQSFEVGNLQELSRLTKVRLVQLFGGSGRPFDVTVNGDERTYSDLATPTGLDGIAAYAAGIGPDKGRVIPRQADGTLGAPTPLVGDAHARGLLVHPYTFRNESAFLPTDLRRGNLTTDYGDAFAEYRAFYEAGVDGLFSDNPDTARLARDERLTDAA